MDTIATAAIDTIRDTTSLALLLYSGKFDWLIFITCLCAFGTVVFAFLTFLYMIKDRRLLTMPLLTFIKITNVNKGFVGLELRNNGYGPAIIKKIGIKVKGKEIDTAKPKYMEEVVKKLETSKSFTYSVKNFEEGDPLSAGYKEMIFRFDKLDMKEAHKDLKKIFTEDFEMKIIYTSLFGVEQTVKT